MSFDSRRLYGLRAVSRDQMHLLVILGAGASFDSANLIGLPYHHGQVPQPALPPPLAIHLVSEHFDHISQAFPQSQVVIDRLRRRRGEERAVALEAELAELADDGSPERRAQMMAFRFYLHRVIEETAEHWHASLRGFTRYVSLCDDIAEWQREVQARVDVVTFNCDVLLERALERVIPTWTFGDDLHEYVSRPDFRLFKLHGSTDWSRLLLVQGEYLEVLARHHLSPPDPTGLFSQSTLPMAMAIASEGMSFTALPFEARSATEGIGSHESALRVPALAVPIADKMDFECPDYHVDLLRAALPDVTHVLVIGWRGAEKHATGLLDGERDPQKGLMPGYALAIVSDSRENALETMSNLGSAGAKGKPLLTGDEGFRGLIESGLEELGHFLRRGYTLAPR